LADLKISQLTDGGASQATDEYVVARSGSNFRIDGASVAAAATSVGTLSSLTVSGDLTVDTSTLKVDSTNNRVGIGTASPAVRLDVVDTAAVARLRSSSSTAADAPRLRFFHEGNDEFHIAGGDGLLFYGGGTNLRMTLTGSGNLGLGVTPSAWTVFKVLQSQRSAFASYSDGSPNAATVVSTNAFYNGSWKYIESIAAASYEQATSPSAAHKWFVAPTGTAGNAITFTQAMTLHASGGLSIGSTADPGAGAVNISGTSTNSQLAVTAAGVANTTIGFNASGGTVQGIANNCGYVSIRQSYPLVFGTAETERARITAGGDFAVGTTSASNAGCYLNASGQINGTVASVGTASFQAWNQATSGDNKFVEFYTEGGSGTLRGSITYNRTGGVVAYNTTSDYRAKDIIGPIKNAGETIDALQVYMGKMHGATIARPMLVAHEAQAVTPYAVTGEKDAVREESYEVTPAEKDEDGNVITEAVMGVREVPVYQQMDHAVLVPLLIAEVQSLRARVAALEA